MNDFFALDLGSYSIKIAQIKKRKGKLHLVALGQTKRKKEENLAVTIRNLVEEQRIKTQAVVTAVPERDSVTRLVAFPPMKKEEVASALRYEAEGFIPYPLKDVYLDYQIVKQKEDGSLLILVAATRRKVSQQLVNLLTQARLLPIALETTAIAITRALNTLQKPTIVAEVGTQESLLLSLTEGQIFASRVVPIGGDTFIKAATTTLNLDPETAWQYLFSYGFQTNQLEGKIRQAILPLFRQFLRHLRAVFLNFQQEWGKEPRLVVLSGGGALISGFAEEITKALSVETQLAQPFANLVIDIPLPIDPQKEGCRFTTVLGLAQRGLR